MRNASNEREDLAHRRARADQDAELARAIHRTPEQTVLPLECPPLQRPLDGDEHRVRLEGLRDVVEGAHAHRLHRGIDRAKGCHQHDGSVRAELSELGHQLDAGLAGHLDVAQDRVELFVPRAFERLVSGGDLLDAVAFFPKELAEHLAHGPVVIDDQQRVRLCRASHSAFVHRLAPGSVRLPSCSSSLLSRTRAHAEDELDAAETRECGNSPHPSSTALSRESTAGGW